MNKCQICGHKLSYKATLAAPGIGSSWECPECGAGYHKVGNKFTLWKDVDPQNLCLTPAQVR